MDASLVTPDGLRKLTSELESLRAKREALLGSRDRVHGEGASEFPAGLLDADELARLDRQIGLLENTLASAIVVQPDPADGEVDVGEVARLRDLDTGELVEYRIVGAGEANPAAGTISYASPVGSALLGRRVGEVVEVAVPSGVLRLEVLEIEL
jgi:transcription elongation factor GreA